MRQIDVHQVIDNARFSSFHWMVMALCALLLIFDGYDLFIYGVVLPSIMQERGPAPPSSTVSPATPPSLASAVFSPGLAVAV